jgi:hypothetical protein
MPDIGEVRSANGETRSWDGTAWRLVPRTPEPSLDASPTMAALRGGGQFLKELVTGQGTARSESLPRAETFGLSLLSGLNPINVAKGLINLPLHPVETASALVDTGKGALQGDPAALGNVAAMVAAPKLYPIALKGVNTTASAIADSPKLRSGIGYIGGAGTAMLTGAGHPFIGAAIGRIASPLLESPAREVAQGTGWLLNKLGGSNATQIERYMPNVSGIPDRGVPPEPLPQGAGIERYMPNVSGIPDRGVPPEPLPRGAGIERYMPNVSGIPDRGVPPEPLPQGAGIERYMPNVSGIPDRGVQQESLPQGSTQPAIDPSDIRSVVKRYGLTEPQAIQLLQKIKDQ